MNNKRWLILIIIGLLLIPVNIFFVPDASAAWWDSDWDYYKTITIESDYIDTDLTYFPMLVNSTNASLIAKCQANGEDVRFLSLDNNTEFAYEIEEWNVGGFSIWVNISEVLTSGSDYQMLMYYGNAGASDNQNPTGVWDSNYMAVWHMNSLLDSTSNNIDLTNSGADSGAAGKVGDCYAFVFANNDYMKHATFLDVMPSTDELTWELWNNHETDGTGADQRMISKTNIVSQDRLEHRRSTGDRYLESFGEGTNDGGNTVTGNTALNDDVWYHSVCTYKSGGNLRLIEDGDDITVDSETIAHIKDGTAQDFYIGAYSYDYGAPDNIRFTMDGYLDEIRISGIVRNDSWIKATFHSQNQTTGFLTFGSEVLAPATPYLSSEYPTNESTNVALTPTLHVTCIDNNSDIMTATWRSNSSGAWVDFATNSSITTTDIIYQTNSNFSAYSTTYWWSVNLTDGTLWDNETYHFTTISANTAPTLSNENPSNNTITIAVDTDLSITIEDPEGDTFNYSWSCSDGSSGSVNSESNGTKTLTLDANLATCTVYTWWVNATDGNDSVNESYSFTTFCPTVPADGYTLSWNETLTQLCTDLVDAEGDGMVYEIRQNDVVIDTGGVHVYTNTTHNFTDTVNNFAHWESAKGRVTSGTAFTATTEFTISEYQNISSVNGSGVNTSDCSPVVWSHHNFSFDLSGYTIRDITGLEVRWYGYGGYYTGGAKPKWNWGTTMYFDTDGSGWYTADSTTPFTTDDWSPVLEWINYSAHHDMVDWIDDNNILNVAVEHTTALNCSVIYTDYIELIVTTISGGVGNGTYCTANVSWWNDTCGTDWSWVVYVTDGHGTTSTTTYTFSNAPCTFSGTVYPASGATGVCPCSDALCVDVTASYNFNMTVYGRSSYETNYTIWDKYVNIAADEYCFCMCGYIVDGWHQPMRFNTTYYWYVNVSKYDNSSLYNETSVFSFTTASDRTDCVNVGGGGGGMGNNAMGVIGLIGIFGLLGYLLNRRRRNNNNNYRY